MLARVGIEARLGAGNLEALLDPTLLASLDDVHVLGADGAAVSGAHDVEDLAQARLIRALQGAGIEDHIHVGLGQAMKARIELGDHRSLILIQGVQIGLAMAAETIGVDQLQHGDLLGGILRVVAHHGHGRALGRGGDGQHAVAHFGVANVAAVFAVVVLQGIEIRPPVVADLGRVAQIGFVKLVQERRVGTEEV